MDHYRVIFLDVDGVLITTASRSAPDPRCITELNRITDTTGAHIVVSSSRRGTGVSPIAGVLRSWGVTGRIVGVTPDRSRSRGPLYLAGPRGLEIQAWLNAHPEVTSFVILDDEADMAHLAAHLVQTDFASGLTSSHTDHAIKLLTEYRHWEGSTTCSWPEGKVVDLSPNVKFVPLSPDFPTLDDVVSQSHALIDAFGSLSQIRDPAIHLILEPVRSQATKLILMIETMHILRERESALTRSCACQALGDAT